MEINEIYDNRPQDTEYAETDLTFECNFQKPYLTNPRNMDICSTGGEQEDQFNNGRNETYHEVHIECHCHRTKDIPKNITDDTQNT